MAELVIEDLTVRFDTPSGSVEVVKSLSLNMSSERIGIVGESGSGKSMTARAIMGLIRRPGTVTATRMAFDGIDLLAQNAASWRNIRGSRIAMILQDPKFSLNPVMRVGRQIASP